MSMDEASVLGQSGTNSELTPLGKAIELMRIERGLAKQQLARAAGISRQQLWRVMTGKSELTNSLAARLAAALGGDPRVVSARRRSADENIWLYPAGPATGPARRLDFESFASSPHEIERTLRTLPSGDPGRRLKRELLNAVEELAGELGLRLGPEFFALRGRVINGEI